MADPSPHTIVGKRPLAVIHTPMKYIIRRNAIQCKHCGDIIESRNVHDFKYCSCRKCAVDGGHDYLRRCFTTSEEEDFIELSDYDFIPDNSDTKK